MNEVITHAMLIGVTVTCLALGLLVVVHNHRLRVNWAFFAISANLGLWALMVLFVVRSTDLDSKVFWLRNTFIVTTALPATFGFFAGYFPRGRFTGSKRLLQFNIAMIPVLVAGSFTPYYLADARIAESGRLVMSYGPLFFVYAAQILVTFGAITYTLFSKLRHATGLDRRQIQYVILGIFLSVVCSTTTNTVLPAMGVDLFQRYGPIFWVLMLGMFAYAMVRYHLLEMRVLIANALANVAIMTFVVGTFIAVMAGGRLLMDAPYQQIQILPTVLSGVVIAFAVHAVRERVKLILDQTILKRKYDGGKLVARITRHTARLHQLNELLDTVVRDIQATVGPSHVRVMLLDDANRGRFVTAYSTLEGEAEKPAGAHDVLIARLRYHDGPIILEKLIRETLTPEDAQIAAHLAEWDVYMCVPLKTSSGLVGALLMGQKDSHDMYDAQDEMIFTALADSLGTAIENSTLYHQLEDVNVHLSRVLSKIREGVIAVDSEGVVKTVNESAKRLFGEIRTGQNARSFHGEVSSLLVSALDTGRTVDDYETNIEGPDGGKIPVVLSTASLNSGKGKGGAMAMIFDLTQVKHLEANVIRAERLSSIGTLAAGMAHEIKNPLVSIKTFTQLLLKRYKDEDFRNTFSDVVPQEVERIDGIVSRLLDFARPKPVEFSAQDIRTIIEKVLALIDNQLRAVHVSVEMIFPKSLVLVNGDEQQLHQLFLNLFLNALDAMKGREPNFLRISAKIDRMRVLNGRGTAPRETDCVRIFIDDTGCGIPEPDISHLFTPFFTTKSNGSGLGLAVVHGIVADHFGDIDVRSMINSGTTFVVSLPLYQELAAVGGPETHESAYE